MNLHYSQTKIGSVSTLGWFNYLMNLHYSQTVCFKYAIFFGLTTLWIYTILKRCRKCLQHFDSLTTLWIYTILKLSSAWWIKQLV